MTDDGREEYEQRRGPTDAGDTGHLVDFFPVQCGDSLQEAHARMTTLPSYTRSRFNILLAIERTKNTTNYFRLATVQQQLVGKQTVSSGELNSGGLATVPVCVRAPVAVSRCSPAYLYQLCVANAIREYSTQKNFPLR